MATQPGDLIRTAARLHVDGQGDVVNVFHHRFLGVSSISDELTVDNLALVMDELYGAGLAVISSGVGFADINVYNFTQLRPLGVVPWPTLTVGGSTGDHLPLQLAAFIRGTTGYSRNWARKFLGPMSETQNEPTGFLTSTAMGHVNAWAAEWLSLTLSALAGSWEPVVYHLSSDLWRTITAVVTSNKWATVRRRRAGRGS